MVYFLIAWLALNAGTSASLCCRERDASRAFGRLIRTATFAVLAVWVLMHASAF